MGDYWEKAGVVFAGLGLLAAITVPELRRCVSLDPGGCPILGAPNSAPPALESSVGLDYSRLRDLLAKRKFAEAELETSEQMLLSVGRKGEGFLDSDSISRLPCTDMLVIDKLWAWGSNEKFSFSAQSAIWTEVKENMDRFVERTNWTTPSYTIEDPIGAHPRYLVKALQQPTTLQTPNSQLYYSLNSTQFSRLNTCKNQ